MELCSSLQSEDPLGKKQSGKNELKFGFGMHWVGVGGNGVGAHGGELIKQCTESMTGNQEKRKTRGLSDPVSERKNEAQTIGEATISRNCGLITPVLAIG